MATRYFKITKLTEANPLFEKGFTSPIEAMKAHLRERRRFNEEASEFAKQFGGLALHSNGMAGLQFHGIVFNGQPERPELWTKPDPKARYSQRPRAKGANQVKGPEMRKLHKELLETWDKRPDPVDMDDQWLCAGYKQIDLVFSGANMEVDFEAGEIYVAAGQPPEQGAEWEEITGGEYQRIAALVEEQKAGDYL